MLRSIFVFLPLLVFCVGVRATVAGVGVWARAQDLSGVPSDKIYAIALQESGMRHPDGLFRPWPWTINSEEGAKRFGSKKEAYDEIKRLAKKGIRNIDVGLMQINLRWNWEGVANTDILNPEVNIMFAAKLLRQRMKSSNGDVDKAIALYHSKRELAGIGYKSSVLLFENQIRAINVTSK